jgi:hypothetical protein
MSRDRRASVGWGVLLVLVGGFFLAQQFGWIPEFVDWLAWPVWILSLGVLFILIALLTGTSGMAVPGAIISGIGGLLYYFNTTGHWEQWTFWMLVPAFVGAGTFLMYLFEGKFEKAIREGGGSMLWGVILFAIFSAIFGPDTVPYREYWPVLLIVLGLWYLIRPMFRKRKSDVI